MDLVTLLGGYAAGGEQASRRQQSGPHKSPPRGSLLILAYNSTFPNSCIVYRLSNLYFAEIRDATQTIQSSCTAQPAQMVNMFLMRSSMPEAGLVSHSTTSSF